MNKRQDKGSPLKKRPKARGVKTCTWTHDTTYGDVYDGACGIKWEFADGGPVENGVKFCPRCGGRVKLEVLPWKIRTPAIVPETWT